MDKREFMIQYVLVRAQDSADGQRAAMEAERAWEYIEKVTPK